MTHGSVFSGIGGFDLAAQQIGWTNLFNCDNDSFCEQILKYWFPKSIHYENIKTTDFTIWRNKIDILTGGFPCQPFSSAGKRKGANDNRYIWPEMLRAIREIRPTWIIGENVAGILSMVQPGKEINLENETSLFEEDYSKIEIQEEYVIETICKDLEQEGYSVQPILIPACAVGAPHRRDRVWFIANSKCERGIEIHNEIQSKQPKWKIFNRTGDKWTFANSNGIGLERRGYQEKPTLSELLLKKSDTCRRWQGTWEKFPTQSPVCFGNDGISAQLVDITFPQWRQQSLKAYGNAIVPQVAYQIFQMINQVNN